MVKKILLGLVVVVVLVLVGGGGWVMMQTSAYDQSMSKVYDIPVDQNFKAPDLSKVAALIKSGKDPSKAAEPVKVADATPPPADGDDAKAGGPAAPDAKGNGEGDTASDAPGAAPDAAAEKEAEEMARLAGVYKRGEHLARSLGACMGCHGEDLATPEDVDLGPIGDWGVPNISMGGKLKDYSDGEFHRLLLHGIKKDGTSLIFMPAHELNWWPDEDYAALLGFLRTVAPSDKAGSAFKVGPMGKVLDRLDNLKVDVARRIVHNQRITAPSPAPNAAYGSHVAKLCMGCHGDTFSGGPIPGAPPSLPIPLNITTHETGIAHYDFAKFEKVLREGIKADGSKLDPFMPIKDIKHMDAVEMKALWEYLQSLEKKPFGGR
jgi:cytochrome c553